MIRTTINKLVRSTPYFVKGYSGKLHKSYYCSRIIDLTGVDDIEIETKTSGITLRPMIASDVDDFMELVTDEKVNKWCNYYDTYNLTSKESVMNYMECFVLDEPQYKAICMQNKVVGSINVTLPVEYRPCRAEVEYSVMSKYWGKGIATKAVEMVTAKIFVEWPHLKRLEAVVDVENPRSQRVLEKAGFNKEAVLRKYRPLKGNPRDMVMFSFIPPDDQQGVDEEPSLDLANKLTIS